MELRVGENQLQQHKTHYAVLDGLRGVAAIAVVCYHFMEIAVADYEQIRIAHSYFAVDFFFCLSGFVIAYAYDEKMAKIGVLNFLKLRFIRLQPLVILGSVLGLLTFLFDPFINLYAIYGFGRTAIFFTTSCLMIPYPFLPERYNNLFNLNAPTWSLFWEYIANIFYAFVLVRINNKLLWLLIGIGAVLLFYTANIYTHLCVGWGDKDFWGGGARTLYSFLAGVLLFRLKWIIKSPLDFFPLAILLSLAFLVPFVNKINWLTDPLIIIFYFPFIVALGAGAVDSPRFKAICKFLGDISYPLYMTHYPFIWLFHSWVKTHKPIGREMGIVMSLGMILLIIIAYLSLKYFDEPVRKYFGDRVRRNRLAREAVHS